MCIPSAVSEQLNWTTVLHDVGTTQQTSRVSGRRRASVQYNTDDPWLCPSLDSKKQSTYNYQTLLTVCRMENSKPILALIVTHWSVPYTSFHANYKKEHGIWPGFVIGGLGQWIYSIIMHDTELSIRIRRIIFVFVWNKYSSFDWGS